MQDMGAKRGRPPDGSAAAIRAGTSAKPSKPTTREYTPEFKERILRALDDARASGDRDALGALLRREGLHWPTVHRWQQQRANTPPRRGRPAKQTASDKEYYRWQKTTVPRKPRPAPKRKLSDAERAHILELLDSEQFMDKAPRQVYAELLDENRYVCSVRTMYRILAQHGQVRERRNQRRHPAYVKPELVYVYVKWGELRSPTSCTCRRCACARRTSC